jgi:5-methylcytosine-specific restriction endonuclease McrA
MSQYKTCSKCKQVKSVDSFNNHKAKKDGKRCQCRHCESLAKKEYRLRVPNKKYSDYSQEEKEAKIKRVISWNKLHKPERTLAMAKRRALKKENGVYSVTAKEIKKIQSMNCLYCGLSGGQVDHVIPLTRGGAHSIGNLVPACRSCNASKNNRTITEWQKKNP